MRVLVVAVVLLVIVALVMGALFLLRRAASQRRRADGPWQLEERSDGELIALYATKPGRDELLVGSVPFAAADFDLKLYELRAEADERVRVLNDR
jgi:hypothetical protein